MDNNTTVRDIVLPIVHGTRQDNGQVKYEKLIGTAFMVNEFPRIGLTASSVLVDFLIEELFVVFYISDQESRSIPYFFPMENIMAHPLCGVTAFFLQSAPFNNNLFPINYNEYPQSTNFITFGYPNEYLIEGGELERPDLAFHDGYIIRRLTNTLGLEDYGTALFEVNLTLSKGFFGAPIVLRPSAGNSICSVIGIYVGTRKFLISKEYNNLIDKIEELNFGDLVKKLREREGAVEITFGAVLDSLPFLLKTPLQLISAFAKHEADNRLLMLEIKNKSSLKEALKMVHSLISEEVCIKYGLAIRVSGLCGWISEYINKQKI